MENVKSEYWKGIFKALLTLVLLLLFPIVSLYIVVILDWSGYWGVTVLMSVLILPLVLPLIWLKKRKVYGIFYGVFVLCVGILIATQWGIDTYQDSITIDTAPSINVEEYLPFKANSKIVKQDSKTLSFDGVEPAQLPIIDGAAALFPVYSAYVHAVYPQTTQLYDGVFEYNNTVDGYRQLAKKKTDLFLGAAPSEEQVAYAKEQRTTFTYTQVGYEAFVFFVHKDNPIESLTLEQVKGIYSGEITNWNQVGGKNEKIVPFQRNEGSGSQSMLLRLMGDMPVVEPDKKTRSGGMGMIVEEVAGYKTRPHPSAFPFGSMWRRSSRIPISR